MDWDLKEELRDCLVAAAPYGGPIGMSPLCCCMFWDNGLNSRCMIPRGPCWQVLLANVATPRRPLSHPLLRYFKFWFSYGVGLGSWKENLFLNYSTIEEPVAEGEGSQCPASA